MDDEENEEMDACQEETIDGWNTFSLHWLCCLYNCDFSNMSVVAHLQCLLKGFRL
jgi:hypothetical protein